MLKKAGKLMSEQRAFEFYEEVLHALRGYAGDKLLIKNTHQKRPLTMKILVQVVGQTTHVLLNMTTDYNARLLAKDIVMYFNVNPDAFEVCVFKGSKSIIVKRKAATAKDFVKKFMFSYYK